MKLSLGKGVFASKAKGPKVEHFNTKIVIPEVCNRFAKEIFVRYFELIIVLQGIIQLIKYFGEIRVSCLSLVADLRR